MLALMRVGEKMERFRRRWFQDYKIRLSEGSKAKKEGDEREHC